MQTRRDFLRTAILGGGGVVLASGHQAAEAQPQTAVPSTPLRHKPELAIFTTPYKFPRTIEQIDRLERQILPLIQKIEREISTGALSDEAVAEVNQFIEEHWDWFEATGRDRKCSRKSLVAALADEGTKRNLNIFRAVNLLHFGTELRLERQNLELDEHLKKEGIDLGYVEKLQAMIQSYTRYSTMNLDEGLYYLMPAERRAIKKMAQEQFLEKNDGLILLSPNFTATNREEYSIFAGVHVKWLNDRLVSAAKALKLLPAQVPGRDTAMLEESKARSALDRAKRLLLS